MRREDWELLREEEKNGEVVGIFEGVDFMGRYLEGGVADDVFNLVNCVGTSAQRCEGAQ